MKNNYMELKFKALSINESFARTTVASFCLQVNPTLEELNDVKTAVSEAVTNVVVHAYPNSNGDVYLSCNIQDEELTLIIKDNGIGINDFELARKPFYTTKPNCNRSGMGFSVMESFMDDVKLMPNLGGGLCVIMKKKFTSQDCKVVTV